MASGNSERNAIAIEGRHASDGNARERALRSMRTLSIALSVFCAAQFALIFYLASRQTVSIPYVIEINREGTARYVENVSTTLSEWKPSVATVMKALEEYLIALRAVSADESVQQERIRKVYAFSTGDALKTAQDYLLENNPLERIGRERVEVNVYSATPYVHGSEELYQLDWNEKTYSANGILKDEANFRCVAATRRYAPKNKGAQEANPLGIYVERLSISRIRDGYAVQDRDD